MLLKFISMEGSYIFRLLFVPHGRHFSKLVVQESPGSRRKNGEIPEVGPKFLGILIVPPRRPCRYYSSIQLVCQKVVIPFHYNRINADNTFL